LKITLSALLAVAILTGLWLGQLRVGSLDLAPAITFKTGATR
jgi:hypothetical protein